MTTDAATVTLAGAEPRRTVFSGAALLSGATLVAGLLAYVFHVVAARALGAEAYGQIAVLWAAMFIVVVVLYRPIEQTLSRGVADRIARGEPAGAVVRTVGLVAVLLLVAVAAAFAAAWGAIGDRLFLGSDLLTAALLAATLAYGVAYFVRGLVGGVRWFSGYSLHLLADAAARIVLVVPLLVVASRSTAAIAIVGAAVAGAVAPVWLARGRLRGLLTAGGERFRVVSALGFAAPACVIAAADQLFVNGAPLLVIIAGGPDATRVAGVVFAATMLVRVPVYLFQGLAASLLPNFTRLQAGADGASFRRAVGRTAVAMAAIGAFIVAATAVVGPAAMALLFGSEFEAGRSELTLLAAGVAFYLLAGTLSQALLALAHSVRAAVCWAAGAALFVGLYVALPGEPLAEVSVAFAAASLAALLLLAGALAGRLRGS